MWRRLSHGGLLTVMVVATMEVMDAVVSGDITACSSQASCGACMLVPNCHWCAGKSAHNSKCYHESQMNKNWCSSGEPYRKRTEVTYRDPGTNVSQIFPVFTRVSLRTREEFKINITYRRLEDYPVDLYYLMDLSASMKDDKKNLAKLGDELAAAMRNVTSNFQLGFGSFVDKVAMPFVNTHPRKLENPCEEDICVRPYSFKNHMSLTNDTKQFTRKVAETPVSGNVDSPEGGFDALMQAMICWDEISWRPDARHLLVMATDASFHIAGDGKLAGVVEPNDEQCHMKNHMYTEGLIYDYPSISQLDRQAHNNSITLIFAVTKEQEKVYKSLSANIRGSEMGTLNNDSSNVKDLVLRVYTKLTETVKISDDSMNKGISVSYRSQCVKGPWSNTNACEKIHAKENITFEVTIKVPSCPRNYHGDIWNETITFNPNGINERAQVELQIICGCNCEQEGNPGFERNSSSCSYHGNKRCGMCHCFDAYTGLMCECDKNQVTNKESEEACISNNITRTICNDRGSCVCNVCKCSARQNPEEVVSGALCECDNFSCLQSPDNEVCGGPERGDCICGKCDCRDGWAGEGCNCFNGTRACHAPGDNQQCSGAGTCDCGTCICNKGYTGLFCEDCTDCTGGRCRTLAGCIEFLVHKTGVYKEEICAQQNITILNITEEKIKESETDRKLGILRCRVPDDSSCSFVFTYQVKKEEILIIAEKEKECPAPVDLLGIVFGVIGGTVLIGLVSILIWKLLTSIHDRREFAKFEKERAQSKWERGDNPLYVQATSTFSNPTFSSGN